MVNINELKAKILAEAQSTRRGLPFKKLNVNHADQVFVVKDGEIEKVLEKEAEIFVVGEYSQYYFYDPKLERITMLSQITKPALLKQALDLKSGKKVSELVEKLKSQGLKPTYTTILVILLKVDNTWEEAVMYLKGAVLQSWLEITKQLQQQGTTHIAKLMKLGLRSQKKGAVKYATLTLLDSQDTEDKDILAKAVILLDKFKEEVKRYNAYEPAEELPIEPTEEAVDDGVEF
jgi:hypothetical protein